MYSQSLNSVGRFVQSHQHEEGPAIGSAVVWHKPTCAGADDARSGAHPEIVRAQVRYRHRFYQLGPKRFRQRVPYSRVAGIDRGQAELEVVSHFTNLMHEVG